MEKIACLRCSVCGQEYGVDEVTYTCPADGGVLDVILDYQEIAASTRPEMIQASEEYSMWRYLPLLPVGEPGGEGTPLNVAYMYRPE